MRAATGSGTCGLKSTSFGVVAVDSFGVMLAVDSVYLSQVAWLSCLGPWGLSIVDADLACST